MIKQHITYTDQNGTECEEDRYFDMTSEIVRPYITAVRNWVYGMVHGVIFGIQYAICGNNHHAVTLSTVLMKLDLLSVLFELQRSIFMNPDYTVNDAFHHGFECGLLYILRFMEENSERRITANDVSKLIVHLEEKKPWKSHDEWEEFILKRLSK